MTTIARGARILLVISSIFVFSACRSRFAAVAPRPPQRYTEVGPASGSACGVLFGFIPIAVNSRTDRAYRAALTASGATMLTDTTMTDSWFWTPIGMFLCTRIDGKGIRDATPGEARAIEQH
jgi:hypothetical protein